MRNLLEIGLLLTSVMCTAQNADIFIDTLGQQIYHDKIQAHSFGTMFGTDHNYKMETIQKIIFYGKPSIELVRVLKDAGVKILYDYDNPSIPTTFVDENKALDNPLSNVTKAYSVQDAGIMLQIVGIGAMAVATVLSVSELDDDATLDDLENRQNLVKGLAIGGGVFFTVGITIKLHGDRQLFKAVNEK